MSDTVVDDTGVTARLAAMAAAVRAALRDTTDALAEQLIAASAERLPDGPLARSLAATIIPDDDGARATLGSALPYAGALEYGFSGTEQVRDSLRRQSVAFGRPMTPREVLVRAHARQVNIPARAYLSGPLDDMSDAIVDTYSDSVRGALAEADES